MTETSLSNPVRPLHIPGNGTGKQSPANQNTTASTVEPGSLKALANQILQKSAAQNKGRTTALSPVSSYGTPEASQVNPLGGREPVFISSSIRDDFEERIAIAEYDGGQSALQVCRIAYEDALIGILAANPPDGLAKPDTDWLTDRVKAAEGWLCAQGIVWPG